MLMAVGLLKKLRYDDVFEDGSRYGELVSHQQLS